MALGEGNCEGNKKAKKKKKERKRKTKKTLLALLSCFTCGIFRQMNQYVFPIVEASFN